MHSLAQRRVLSLLLVLLVVLLAAPLAAAAPGAPQAVTVFSEGMYDGSGSVSGTQTIAFFETGNYFQNDALTMSGTGDMRTTTASAGYAGASGSYNVFLTNTAGRYFEIADINTTSYSNLILSFGVYKSTTAETGSSLTVAVSSDGTTWTPLTVPALPTGTGTAIWHYRTASGAIPTTSNLRVRFTNTSTTPQFRIDDVSLVGDPAGDTPPTVASTVPTNGAANVALNTTITINFSDNSPDGVDVAAGAFTVECPVSTVVAFSPAPALPANNVTSVVLTPDSALPPNTTCTVTVLASQVTDNDGTADPMAANFVFSFTTVDPNACNATFTPIYSIQGSGLSAAITGPVTTQGVVVGDFELPAGSDQIRGFYLQDLAGDANAATSDGIFVYNGGVDTVAVGQVVRVQGTAGEFAGQTQISSPTVTPCGTSSSVEPVVVTLPFASADYPERFEGMLVRLSQTLYVSEHFQLGRFGQVVLTSRQDRLQQPTNVVAPGAPALALQAANNLDRIILDDDNNLQNTDPVVFGRGGNPLSASNTLRGGDSAANVIGVLVYDWAGNSASPSAYRVRPIGALNRGVVDFQPANPRPAPPAVSGRLRVTAANLLNYFNTFGTTSCTFGVGGGVAECRGANSSTEFDRQWPKTVASLVDGGADVIGVMEIENDGYGEGSAIQHLVTKLNDAAGTGTYAFINADAGTGQVNALGTDAIKVGLIYKPAKVTPVGATAALNTTAFVNGGDTSPRNRPALAQAFQEVSTDQRFIVVVNHLKSKGSACNVPDAGDGQGNCNIVRTNAATLLTAWLASNPTGTGDSDILIMGDLNSYAQEDPITAIKSAGYTNLIQDRLGMDAYSYAFNGQWGYLDHALATATLDAQVTGVLGWHINSDEPTALDYNMEFKTPGQITSLYSPDRFRSSDHDPVIIGLDLSATLGVTLAAFNAEPQPDRILVAWETVSELDNAGFNLYRAGSVEDWEPSRRDRPELGDLLVYLPSQAPGSTQGAAYSFEDLDVQPGQTYWYWLEDVSLGGATTLHGPVSATVQAPTAVTLNSVSATPAAAGPGLAWLWLAAGAGLALGVGRRRRRG